MGRTCDPGEIPCLTPIRTKVSPNWKRASSGPNRRRGRAGHAGCRLSRVLVAVGIAIAGILVRRYQESEVTKWTVEQAVPVVATVMPKQGVSGQQIVLPGDIEAWYEAPIYARVSGYLKAWYFDFGAHVQKGPAARGNRRARSRRPARRRQSEAGVRPGAGQGQGGGAPIRRHDLYALAQLAQGRRLRAGDRVEEGGIRQRRRALQRCPGGCQCQPEPGRSAHRAGGTSSASLLRSTAS